MKKFMIETVIYLFFISSALAGNSSGIIEGQVIDGKTKQVIEGALVEVLNTPYNAVSDKDGFFVIRELSPGTYFLRISAPYYKTAYKTDVLVNSIQSSKIIVQMTLSSYELEEVSVTADRLFNNPDEYKVSINTLNQEEIRRAPGAAEDLFRMIQSLPGVTTASDSRNDLIVRGGSPFENFVMIDGIEVPNLNHFGTQAASGGPIGMVNVDFLDDLHFSAGGFPVKYGDKLSSITDIRYRDGDKKKLTGKFDLGVAGAGFVLEGPIQAEKSSFLFSARKSYLDLILSSTGLTAVPNYSNYNLKATYEINKNHKLSLLGLGGIDDINFKNYENEESPVIENTKYTGWQGVIGISHRWLVSADVFLESSLSGSIFKKDIFSDSLGRMTFSNQSIDRDLHLRSDLTYRISVDDVLDLGFSARYISNNNKFIFPSRLNEFGIMTNDINYEGTAETSKSDIYLQYTRKLFDVISISAGLRLDYFGYINDNTKLSPRISGSYQLLGNLKLNAAYGIYYQAPPLLWLLTDSRNKDLSYMRSDHIIFGAEYFPEEDIKISVEFFNKDYSDYANSVDNPQISYSNAGADYYTYGLEYLRSGASGYARGVDVFIQKKLTKNLYGMLNYSYSDIKTTSLDGIERPSTFDYRSVFTAILGYKFSDNFEISMKYRYMGGRPYTPFDNVKSSLYNRSVFDYTSYNGARFKDYQRIDLRADYKVEFSSWAIITFIDFQNLFNTANVEQIIWNQKTKRPDEILQWKFLPAGGVKILF